MKKLNAETSAAADGALQQILSDHAGEAWKLAIAHDGRCLATNSEDSTVKLYRLSVME